MSTGFYISGAAHLFLILWAILGGVLFRADEPVVLDTASVSLISESEFLSLTDGRPEPNSFEPVEAMNAPATEETPNVENNSEPRVNPAPTPEIAAPSDPDDRPDKPDLSVPEANVDDQAPDAPLAPNADQIAALLPPSITPGRPKDAPRVAPTPIPEAPPKAQEAPEFVPTVDTTSDPIEEAPETPEEDPAAPLEATTEIVTEADQDAPEGTVVSAFRPRFRPPARDTAPQAETATEETPEPSGQTAQNNNVDPDLPVGPPLNFGEVNQLVAAMEQCWRPGSLSTAAASSTVVVGMKMNSDGTPVSSSIRLISAAGPDAGSEKLAYETAKRAVMRCGLRGFPLPKEKYAHWAEIEITFSPDAGLLFE